MGWDLELQCPSAKYPTYKFWFVPKSCTSSLHKYRVIFFKPEDHIQWWIYVAVKTKINTNSTSTLQIITHWSAFTESTGILSECYSCDVVLSRSFVKWWTTSSDVIDVGDVREEFPLGPLVSLVAKRLSQTGSNSSPLSLRITVSKILCKRCELSLESFTVWANGLKHL